MDNRTKCAILALLSTWLTTGKKGGGGLSLKWFHEQNENVWLQLVFNSATLLAIHSSIYQLNISSPKSILIKSVILITALDFVHPSKYPVLAWLIIR